MYKSIKGMGKYIDIILTLLLIIFKLTIIPEMDWRLVAVPLLVSFSYGLIKGFSKGIYEGRKKRNKSHKG
jgi:hypothetical protein